MNNELTLTYSDDGLALSVVLDCRRGLWRYQEAAIIGPVSYSRATTLQNTGKEWHHGFKTAYDAIKHYHAEKEG